MEINKKTRIRIFLEQVLGWFCVVAGILGLLLPFFQGLLLIAIGLVILSAVYPKLQFFIQEKFKQAENWNPKIAGFVKNLEKVYRKVVSAFEVKK
jgi:hypothetical protein